MEYAIVDIETTGSFAAGNGITEIAILIHNGKKVIDRYETLINPQRPIPLSIQALTGITDEMVADSPLFEEVAGDIYHMLNGRVFVAHHVHFDYSFVRHHLQLAGYPWTANKLCTVRFSRKVRPGLPSYSLGRLCRELHIPIVNRHRAGGDAEATAVLFSRLLEWDTAGYLQAMLKKTSSDQRLPPNLPPDAVTVLPEVPGVYYFRNRAGKAVYIGKAVNLRRRVLSHFSGYDPDAKRQHFLRDIYSITYEQCGTELMALLLEAVEIKRYWPVYNRAMKRFEPKYGLYVYSDQKGYLRLAVGRYQQSACVYVCNRQQDAVNELLRIIRKFKLEPLLCHFGSVADPGAAGTAGRALPGQEAYNSRVREALEHLKNDRPSFAILDAGRTANEISCIWVENGTFFGMGYIDPQPDADRIGDVRDRLSRYPGNQYMMQLIRNFAEKYPRKVHIQEKP